jgi:hypothetical protein
LDAEVLEFEKNVIKPESKGCSHFDNSWLKLRTQKNCHINFKMSEPDCRRRFSLKKEEQDNTG